MSRLQLYCLCFAMLFGGACDELESRDVTDVDATRPDSDTATRPDLADGDVAPLPVVSRFDVEGGFFDAPFPIASRLRDDGSIRVADLPNPGENAFLEGWLAAVEGTRTGFARSTAIYLPFDGPIDPDSLPESLDLSTADGSAVQLVNVDVDSPGYGERLPLRLAFHRRAGRIRAGNLLAALPYPGVLMRPETLYALIATDDLRGEDGRRVVAPASLRAALVDGSSTGDASLDAGLVSLRTWLADAGLEAERVVAATVFETGRPTEAQHTLQAHAEALGPPSVDVVGLLREGDNWCAYEARTELPIYQSGDRPYTEVGSGAIQFDATGEPIVQWTEAVRFLVAVPRAPMPPDGYPLLFYVTGGGGKWTQVLDRATLELQATQPENGLGPAHNVAREGIASLGFEMPLVGARHPDGTHDSAEFFNVVSLTAFRDNIRQAAAELSVMVSMAEALTLDVSQCDGADTGGEPAFFDTSAFYVHGQSTGASIGELVLATDRRIRAGVLTGAGGSWIYNISRKQQPLAIGDAVALTLGLPPNEPVDDFHPLATLFQHAIDPAEAMYFGEQWIEARSADADATSVLLVEGVVDGYFPPRMVDALTMAGRLDVAGPLAEGSVLEALRWSGGSHVGALPVGPNRDSASAWTIQFAADGFDGHHVGFELPSARYAIRCFLSSHARTDTARVPDYRDVTGETMPCPTP